MKKSIETNNGSKSDADRAKKVYRAALESIKSLDKINNEKKAYREVFRQDAVGLRNKLKDYCERLMFFNPTEYGRKAEEVLWRKVFYDVIQVVKKSRDHLRHHGSVETAYRTHLYAAAGYYQHLVFRLQREFSLRLTEVIDYYQLSETRSGRKADITIKTVNPAIQEWAQRACHRCLICLGDISRYICDVDSVVVPTTSERYYHQAFMLFPEIGMPHNQLGTLAGSRYTGCEAAYHYIRCLSCEKPFEGAQGNLSRLFEKNNKKYEELNKAQDRDLPPEEQRHQDIKGFFTKFLKLLEIFHGVCTNIDIYEMQQLCQYTLQDFNLCMFYEPNPQEEENHFAVGFADEEYRGDPGDPTSFQYLDDGIVFKTVACLMCTVHLLEKNGSGNITAATAFMLALFSHILNHVVIRLQAALEEIDNPSKILLASTALSMENINAEISSGSEDEVSQQKSQENSVNLPTKKTNTTNEKKSRGSKLQNLRRRRQRRKFSDSSEDNVSDLSETSDLSEGENYLEEEPVSTDSEDDALASYFDHGSDSDLSETEGRDNSDLKGGSTNNKLASNDIGENKWPSSGQSLPNGDMKHIWSNGSGDNSLAHMSSELFSSSLMFLGQDLASNSHGSDIFQTTEDPPIPPGFGASLEAKHVQEIAEKLANFDIETDTETFFPTDTETDEADNENSSSSNAEKHELEQKRLQQTLEVVQRQGLLPTVKLMCDWMRCQASIISVCAQSSHSLWQRMAVLLNFLPHENDISQHESCWPSELQTIATQTRSFDWAQVFPLTEDIEMCQIPSVADVHSQIDFSTRHRAQLSDLQETFLRICCLRRFGYFLTSVENIEFSYQPETAMFLGPSADTITQGNQTTESLEKMKDTESRRNQLMRDMAQLRLQAEVKELEGHLKKTDQPVFPPYVLVDWSSLTTCLGKVKQLVASARCIVVIPLAVVDELDLQKKDSSSAREAIRWLEIQLRKGNRYIRAQKTKETLTSNKSGIMKKRNRNSWYMLELLSCSRYLAQQTGTFTGHSVVVILSAQSNFMNSPITSPVHQAKMAAQQEGVSVDNMTDFFQRWKSVLEHQEAG